MENISPEVIIIGTAALCILTPGLIYLGARLFKKKPKFTYDKFTEEGLKEVGFSPEKTQEFFDKYNIKPKPLLKFPVRKPRK